VVANPGDTIKIRKHVTISDLFGATNSAGLDGGIQIGQADVLTLLDSGSPSKATKKIFYTVDPEAPEFDGWYDAAGFPAGDVVIEPQQGVQILRSAAVPTDLNIVRVGHVKTGPTKFTVDPGLNILAVPLATGTTLAASGLKTDSSSTGVLGGTQVGTSDTVKFLPLTGAALTVYFSTEENGWLTAGGAAQDNYVMKEGTGFFLLRKTAAGAFPWTIPAQVIAQ
jgi:hypothetical protein